MYTLGRRSRTHSLLAAASLTAACASQPSSIARPPAPVDLNAAATARVDATASTDERSTSRGDIPRGEWARYARMVDLLAARVPALDVRPIGSGRFTLRVRGHTTLPNAEPVVVIDGMRYLKNGAEMLASIAPREVKRIEVLRDAASVAGFSSVDAGGVVLVTTWRH
jgi:outer membrane receptor protein involved in Fe transport